MGLKQGRWKECDGTSPTFHGVPMAWKSKAQPLCSLSSSESEYIAISELVKEVLFAKQTVEDFGCKVEVPINTCCDNQGAINMVRNNASGAGTRHVNTRFHFVRELHDDIIMCVHREGGENESDIMTKNPTSAEFEKHSPKMCCEVPLELLEKVKKEEGC